MEGSPVWVLFSMKTTLWSVKYPGCQSLQQLKIQHHSKILQRPTLSKDVNFLNFLGALYGRALGPSKKKIFFQLSEIVSQFFEILSQFFEIVISIS